MAMLNNQRVLETDNLPLDDSIEWSRMLVYLSCEHVPFKGLFTISYLAKN